MELPRRREEAMMKTELERWISKVKEWKGNCVYGKKLGLV